MNKKTKAYKNDSRANWETKETEIIYIHPPNHHPCSSSFFLPSDREKRLRKYKGLKASVCIRTMGNYLSLSFISYLLLPSPTRYPSSPTNPTIFPQLLFISRLRATEPQANSNQEAKAWHDTPYSMIFRIYTKDQGKKKHQSPAFTEKDWIKHSHSC